MPAKAVHPFIFLVLYLPWGISLGYFSVTLGFLNAAAGISTAAIAGIVSLFLFMGVLQILRSPLVDTVFSYRGWFFCACLALGLGLALTGFIRPAPATMPILTVLTVLVGAAATLTQASAGGLMARATAPAQQGRAGGWSQVGGLGGTGLGGGGGLFLATHSSHPWLAACLLGMACSACTLILLFMPEPDHSHRGTSTWATLREVAWQGWAMMRSRTGALAMLLLTLPMCTGAASGLWSAIAGDWGAGADTVSLVTGVGGGVANGVGCLIGGYVCDAMNRRAGYLLPGVLMALCALAMAAAGKTPANFTVFTLIYGVVNGMCYGACYAVMLESGGTVAAAAKCNFLISLCNIPITVMTAVDGAVQSARGSNAMLETEAALGLTAALVFVAVSTCSSGAWRVARKFAGMTRKIDV